MKRMALIILAFMIGIYLLKYLPDLMSAESSVISRRIEAEEQTTQDIIFDMINEVLNWNSR